MSSNIHFSGNGDGKKFPRIDIFFAEANLLSISSSLIESNTLADKIVEDALDYGARYEDAMNIEMALNPYLEPNSLIKINEASWSDSLEELMRVEEVVHRYNSGSIQKSYIKGYIR